MKRSRLLTVWMGALLLVAGMQPAMAELAEFADPEQRARYHALLAELRCTVCQNQNLLDSSAGLAMDLRRQVHTMVTEGKADPEIIDFMVTRYGEFVLYRPPVRRATYALWFAPFALLAIGLGTLVFTLRHRRTGTPPSPVDRQELERLLEKPSERNPK